MAPAIDGLKRSGARRPRTWAPSAPVLAVRRPADPDADHPRDDDPAVRQRVRRPGDRLPADRRDAPHRDPARRPPRCAATSSTTSASATPSRWAWSRSWADHDPHLPVAPAPRGAVAAMRLTRAWWWLVFIIGFLYFFVPLLGDLPVLARQSARRSRRAAIARVLRQRPDRSRQFWSEPRLLVRHRHHHDRREHRPAAADRVLGPPARAAGATVRRVRHAPAVRHPADRARVRTDPARSAIRRCRSPTPTSGSSVAAGRRPTSCCRSRTCIGRSTPASRRSTSGR